ncbi:cell wall-binding repeat-containing protein [Clostridium botulinum]|nr:cell wall-binding repeat-containing protein [Clostridium botulinum]
MNLKKILSFTVTAIILSSSATVFASSNNKLNHKRIYGKDRYETSIKVSKEGWKKSSYAVVCRGDNFPDAICSVPLAKKYNAPILLMNGDGVSDDIKKELKRLNVNKVFITGGQGVITKSTEKQIKSISNIKEVERLGGADRYDTSRKIAQKVGCKGEIVLVSGTVPADSLSISSIAANKNMPIILASKDKNPIQNYLKSNKVNKSFLIGGEVCVSKEIQNLSPNPERIYGKNRFETNEKIIKRFSDTLSFKNVYMAIGQSERGDEFADALTSSALAAKDNSPIVLMYKYIYKDTEKIIKSKVSKESTIVVLGGETLISESTVEKMINIELSAPEKNSDSNSSSSEKDGKNSKNNSSSSKKEKKNSNSNSNSSKTDKEKLVYTISMGLSFPGAFTYDLKVNGQEGKEKITNYQLIYDGKIIAEDSDGDGIVRPLAIFFGKNTDKSKMKIVKDGKEIKVKAIDK